MLHAGHRISDFKNVISRIKQGQTVRKAAKERLAEKETQANGRTYKGMPEKSNFFLVARPLRGGGEVKAGQLRKK